ncbi:MAG: DUF3822 family protein [Ferruginibacter sp.]
MKPAFNILPDAGDKDSLHLLIEVGEEGISFVWYSKSPSFVQGLAVYNFPDGLGYNGIAAEIDAIFRSNGLLNNWYTSVTICYDFKESLLLPAEYNIPNAAEEMLNLVYDSGDMEDIRTEPITATSMLNAYAVDKKIAAVLLNKFPEAATFHSSSLLLQKMQANGTELHCIIFHNTLKVFLFKEGALQFTQQFHYTKPVDVSYHLLNSCAQYNINGSEVSLFLSGMVEAHSNLYNEIYKYFLNIQFESQDPGIHSHDRIRFYPEHFFSHLIAMVSCVS